MKIFKIKYLFLIIWIIALVSIGSVIGNFTMPNIASWYKTINKSNLTPPDYVFGIVWTILYIMIACAGFLIWHAKKFPKINLIKILYVLQLVLNFSWSPIFFNLQLLDWAFFIIIFMICLLLTLMVLSYNKIRYVVVLLIPYLCWISFASYLNFYIWQYN